MKLTKTLPALIAAILLTVASTEAVAGSCGGAKHASTKDIVETAVAAGSFKTLVTAVQAAGLVDTLKSKGPFTVFAPVDSAFAKLPEGAIDGLLKDKAKLTAVLTYHVVPDRVLSADIAAGTTQVRTVNGLEIRISRSEDGAITVNGAKVISKDIVAGNGVIHVIDSVILPQQG